MYNSYVSLDIVLNDETVGQLSTYITFVLLIGGILYGIFKWYTRQNNQDDDIKKLNKDIDDIHKEQSIICKGILACLDGLEQQGCNHTVPATKKEIESYLNEKAHNKGDD